MAGNHCDSPRGMQEAASSKLIVVSVQQHILRTEQLLKWKHGSGVDATNTCQERARKETTYTLQAKITSKWVVRSRAAVSASSPHC